jgi:hypothetical protein
MAQSKARYLSSLLTASGFVKDDRSQLAGSDGEIDLINLPTIPNSKLENYAITVNSQSIALGDSNTFTTDAFAEGNTNLYYQSSRADSDAKNAISAGTGITYNANTGIIEITATGVTPGQYGSTVLVPVLTVDSQGQITTISTVTPATVDSFGYDPINGKLTITTADAATFTADITLAPFTTADLTEGANLYYTQGRVDSDFDARLATKTTDNLTEGNNLYYTTARFDSDFGDNTTSDLTEGNNLYYTQGRFDSAFNEKTTSNLDEGTNLYYTEARFDARLATKTTTDVAEGTNLYYLSSRFDSDFGGKTTNALLEGNTNLYFTELRARNALGLQQNGGDGSLTYDSDTGRFTFIGASATETRAHFVGGTGLTYDSASGVFSITNSGVTNGTYGSTTAIPVFTVNAQGQIDSAGTVSIDAVSSITFDSVGGNLTIATTDGNSYNTTVTLDPFTTSNLAEGSNLYYTQARFDTAFTGKSTTDLSEGNNLYYTTARADSDAKNAISVTDAGGDGSLSYNAGTGTITYTGPSAAETRAHFSGGTGVTITNGSIAIAQSVGTTDDVQFGKVTADSAALDNIVLTRRTSAPKPDASLVGGELYFDSDGAKGLTFIPRTKEGNTDVAINIGQEEVVYVYNDTGETIQNGSTIRFVGAHSDGSPTVEKTLANTPISGPIGMATQDIPDGAHGYITTQGIVRGIDTIRQTTGGPFSVGDRAYICNVQQGGWVKHAIGPDSGYPFELGTVVIADSNDGAIFINPVREHWTRARFSGKVKTSGELEAVGKVTTKAITFDGTVPEYAEGTIFYDSANGAIAFKNDVPDITMQIGQEDWVRVYNNSGSQINNGQPVHVNGVQSNTPTIELADATDANKVHAIGLATHDIANGSYGYVTTKGVVNNVDTSAFSAGDKVHVGTTPGTFSTVAPTYPYFAVDLGYVLTADSAGGGGSILVNIVDHSFEVTRTTGDARFDQDVTVGGNLTVLGTQTIAATENISIGGAFNYLNAGDTIGEANTTFTGSGLDDATLKGHYKGTATNQKFYVKIDGTGGTDTFEWGFADSASPEATGVAITGSEQELNYGIKVEFVATTGHTSGDTWKGSASPVNVDTGWFSNRNTGTSGVGYTHIGMFFDASEEKFTLVEEYDPEPEGDISLDSATLGTLKLGTLEGNVIGNVTGNADTATLLETGRTIGISGDITGSGVSFNGSQNITISTSITAGAIVNADINASAAIADTKLATISTAGKVQNSATTATNANTASAIVARDASGNFSAGTITAALIGNVTGNVTGNAGTATTLATGRNFSITGDVTASAVSFDGSGNVQLTAVIDSDGISHLKTDDLPEGTNKYYTDARARAAISAGGNLSYDPNTGVMSYTDSDRTSGQIRGLFSASGDLSYNSGTGQFSFSETYSTANELLTAIKTVDGATSGLDADLLDGQHGSYYRINVYNSAGTLLN